MRKVIIYILALLALLAVGIWRLTTATAERAAALQQHGHQADGDYCRQLQ